jgi:probable HAF family extracellular repeat protein
MLLAPKPAARTDAALARSAPAAPEYMVLDLGRLLGDRNVARGLNFSGHIAGRSGSHQGTGGRAFFWTPALGARFLGTLAGGDFSGASAVNLAGQVVGSSNTATALRAFLWTPQGGMRDLGALPGDTSSRALAINDAGLVVGYSSGSGGIRAFLWSQQGEMQALGGLPGYRDSIALDITNFGDVAGYASSEDGVDRAVRWAPGIEDLGVLPSPYHLRSRATALNERGDVVGISSGRAVMHGFLWTKRDGMRDLGTLPGGTNSRALSINPSGVIVGGSDSSEGARAFIWTAAGGMRDLNDLVDVPGLTLLEALRINAPGQIVAVGARPEEESHLHRADDHHGVTPDHEAPTNVFLLTPLSF